jgi:hypothetical protein
MEAYAKLAMEAAQAGNWRLAIAASLILSVVVVRWLAPKLSGKLGAFFKSNRGGSILVLLGGVAGAIGSALLAKQALTSSLLISGVTMGVTASGGWNVVWDLVSPADKPPNIPAVSPPPTPPEPPKEAA